MSTFGQGKSAVPTHETSGQSDDADASVKFLHDSENFGVSANLANQKGIDNLSAHGRI